MRFSTIIALHVQFLKLTYIVITRMYILMLVYLYTSIMDTWTGKNYESLHCCGKFAFTSDDTEERWMLCVLFSFSFYIIVKPRRPREKSTFNLRRSSRLYALYVPIRYLCEYANIIRIILIGISDRQHARRGVMEGWGGWVERREGERFFHFAFKICKMPKDIMNTIVLGDWLIVTYCL